MPPIQYIDEPNLIVPLAASYNTRARISYTDYLTSPRDQVKVNCVYEIAQNPITGNTTPYLAKRRGVGTVRTGMGTSGQTAWLVEYNPNFSGQPWLFNQSSNDLRVSDSSASTVVILTTTSTITPAYVDSTDVSGVQTVVIQFRASSGVQRVFYTTSLAGWTELSTSVFASILGKIEHLDGYSFFSTSKGIQNSNLNNISTWPDSGFIRRNSVQDAGVGIGRLGARVISWGAGTMEVYRNVGKAFGSPLERIPEFDFDIGLSMNNGGTLANKRHYCAVVDGWLYWIGMGSSAGSMAIYGYNGSRVEKVSPPGIDNIITLRGVNSVSKMYVSGESALALALDVAGASPYNALLYFPRWKDWFHWDSTVFQCVGSKDGLMLPGLGVSSNVVFGGFGSTANSFQDGASAPYTMSLRFKLPNSGNAHRRLHMFGVKGDTALSTTTSVLNVRFTTDDWQTSTAARAIDMTKAKKHIYRCGGYSDLGVYLDHTANLDCRLEAVVARVE